LGDTATRQSYHESQIQYAQSYLELAKLELRIAEDHKTTLSNNAAQQKRNMVKIAEEQLRVASLPIGEGDTVPVRMRYAEENAKSSRQEYLNALSSTKESRFAFTDDQLERLRLKAEVARHRLSVMTNPIHLMSLLDHMHWEIDRLNEDLIMLQARIETLEKQ
jgi:hypothetical protein